MQIGCASVSAEVVSKATHGVFQVAAVWGLVVIISISLFGRISGAHFNPAISLAMAIWRPDAFSARSQLGPYIISQFVGALLGASITIATSYSSLLAFEELHPTLARSTGDDAWSHTQRCPKFKLGSPQHGSVPSTCAPRLV
jgi:glycerol uptake facilitator-like aquaporin